jgi:hypothetical protein
MSVTSAEQKMYRFGPLEKKGLVMGLRAGQIIIAASAVVLSLLAIITLESVAALLAVVVLLGGAFGSIFMEPMGRGVDEWIPVIWRWLSRIFRSQNSWITPVPLLGTVVINGSPTSIEVPLPESLKSLQILSIPVQDSNASVGIVKDKEDGTYTGVLAVRGTAFALLDSAEKERRLSSWGDVLSGLARPGSTVHRLQWIERTLPDDGDGLNRYLAEARTDETTNFHRSYVDLLQEYGPQNQQHEIYIALQIHAGKKAARGIRKAGGGDEGAAQVILRELKHLAFRLGEADIVVEGALTPRLLSRAFRTAVDPESSREIARRGRINADDTGVAPEQAWPMSIKTQWGMYQTDNAYHITYWISEWPRLEVNTDFLAPLMIRSSRMRTVSLVMEPHDSARSAREIETRHTSYLADEKLRSNAGYVSTKRRQNELESIERREAELASGYIEYRISGYVTVTALSLDELEEACNEVEQAAQQSRLELRRLFGEQDWAFTCTLPTARGLGKR